MLEVPLSVEEIAEKIGEPGSRVKTTIGNLRSEKLVRRLDKKNEDWGDSKYLRADVPAASEVFVSMGVFLPPDLERLSPTLARWLGADKRMIPTVRLSVSENVLRGED